MAVTLRRSIAGANSMQRTAGPVQQAVFARRRGCTYTAARDPSRRGEVAAGRHLRFLVIVAALAGSFHASPAQAQHAADNPVTAAEDAFGLTLGLESVGMYSSGLVR